MDLYVIRHADAGNPKEWKGDDADRPLSLLGHQQARALGEAFRQRGISVGAVISSPLVRTRETAEELLRAWPGVAGPEFCDLLAPGALRRRKLSRFLAGMGGQSLAIVGHDPDLPAYLGWLLGTDPEQVHLEKAGAALVRFEDVPGKGEGTLAWMVTPEWYMPPAPPEPTAV
ncbi:MAG: phosphohistidine phosphatase [Gemmataceae bacterium]|nr:phosphohistidine phosphatase [Gemmataceae bacterium]